MSDDFAVRITPIVGAAHPYFEEFEHEWAYFHQGVFVNGSQFPKTVILDEFKFPVPLMRALVNELQPESPWAKRPIPDPDDPFNFDNPSNPRLIDLELIYHCEQAFADLVEPARNGRIAQAILNNLATMLPHYGQWLLNALVLGNDANARSEFQQALVNQAANPISKFRLLLTIDEAQKPADQQHQKTCPARDLLSSLTFELIHHAAGNVLHHPNRLLYRIPPARDQQPQATWESRVHAFIQREQVQVCKNPKLYLGIAGPNNNDGLPSVPLLTMQDSLLGIVPRLDLLPNYQSKHGFSGELQMRFSNHEIQNGIGPHDLVVIMAHGHWDEANICWTVNLNQSQTDFGSCLVPQDALGIFLAGCEARLAVIFCCQERKSTGAAHPDLAEQLLKQIDRLAAVVTFRSQLPMTTARQFLESLVQTMGGNNRFELAPLLAAARYATTNQIQNPMRLEWAIPAFHVRGELAWQLPPSSPWVSLEQGTNIPDFQQNQQTLENAINPLMPQDAKQTQNLIWGGSVPYNPGYFENQIASFPVTWEDYQSTLGSQAAPRPGDHKLDWPVTGLTIRQIDAYLNQKTQTDSDNWTYRLPTFIEWILAAYAPNYAATLFPWGNEWNPDAANLSGTLVSVYDTQPTRPILFGMIGNCWELLCTGQNSYLLIGGDCHSEPWQCTPCYRAAHSGAEVDAFAPANNCCIGFRVVRSK